MLLRRHPSLLFSLCYFLRLCTLLVLLFSIDACPQCKTSPILLWANMQIRYKKSRFLHLFFSSAWEFFAAHFIFEVAPSSLFEFRMLDNCPALTMLVLEMVGPDAPQGGCTVLEPDLCSSRTDTESGHISCPNLKTVSSNGRTLSLPNATQSSALHLLSL